MARNKYESWYTFADIVQKKKKKRCEAEDSLLHHTTKRGKGKSSTTTTSCSSVMDTRSESLSSETHLPKKPELRSTKSDVAQELDSDVLTKDAFLHNRKNKGEGKLSTTTTSCSSLLDTPSEGLSCETFQPKKYKFWSTMSDAAKELDSDLLTEDAFLHNRKNRGKGKSSTTTTSCSSVMDTRSESLSSETHLPKKPELRSTKSDAAQELDSDVLTKDAFLHNRKNKGEGKLSTTTTSCSSLLDTPSEGLSSETSQPKKYKFWSTMSDAAKELDSDLLTEDAFLHNRKNRGERKSSTTTTSSLSDAPSEGLSSETPLPKKHECRSTKSEGPHKKKKDSIYLTKDAFEHYMTKFETTLKKSMVKEIARKIAHTVIKHMSKQSEGSEGHDSQPPLVLSNRSGLVHEDIVCDCCDCEIVETRCICVTCSNFDLCEECKNIQPSFHDRSHVIKLRRPCLKAGTHHGVCKSLPRHIMYECMEEERQYSAEFASERTFENDAIVQSAGKKFLNTDPDAWSMIAAATSEILDDDNLIPDCPVQIDGGYGIYPTTKDDMTTSSSFCPVPFSHPCQLLPSTVASMDPQMLKSCSFPSVLSNPGWLSGSEAHYQKEVLEEASDEVSSLSSWTEESGSKEDSCVIVPDCFDINKPLDPSNLNKIASQGTGNPHQGEHKKVKYSSTDTIHDVVHDQLMKAETVNITSLSAGEQPQGSSHESQAETERHENMDETSATNEQNTLLVQVEDYTVEESANTREEASAPVLGDARTEKEQTAADTRNEMVCASAASKMDGSANQKQASEVEGPSQQPSSYTSLDSAEFETEDEDQTDLKHPIDSGEEGAAAAADSISDPNQQLNQMMTNTFKNGSSRLQQLLQAGKDIFKTWQTGDSYEYEESTYEYKPSEYKLPENIWQPSSKEYNPLKCSFHFVQSQYQLPKSNCSGPKSQVSTGLGFTGDYAGPLQRIREMGYFNNESILDSLRKHNGDIQTVVSELEEVDNDS